MIVEIEKPSSTKWEILQTQNAEYGRLVQAYKRKELSVF
jgi:hypothetical protein